jgi:2-keto-3-deoxy-L-rhamnonate aldolase RhmA
MEAARVLRQKIADQDHVTTGVLCTFHFWSGMVEMAMTAGLDYLIIDMEHMTHDAAVVADACAVGRREGFPILIRSPATEFTPIRLALDLGPCGLLLPMVESLEMMQTIQDAAYLRPRGRRRPGGPGNLWVSDVNYATWRSEFEDDLIVLPQIESESGLANAVDIAAHAITTAIAVGPYDLSAALGVCWQPDSPQLQGALERIRAAGAQAGKSMWMIGDGPTLVERGYRFLCIAEPTMHLQASLGDLNRRTKQIDGTYPAAGFDARPLP